ncbi:hypothetical protein [Aeromonas hydrophila]|uniref:hypothetical protein n=1 Tax=Aeromonas hydrophila TaxID=644 RepID=UPI000D0D71A6|nr:hypothetical protein [Aeromonas hydrophila]AVP85049.1 hypothetical protein C7K70_13815 [Aeromonas hydrophila]MCS3791262.1 hypothetical protein [Aeromonas hydrophila]
MGSVGFYENDEGVCCDLLLKAFGSKQIQVINLEHNELYEKFKEDVRFFYKNQMEIHQTVIASIDEYVRQKYQSDDHSLELMKIYTFHDVEREFGLLFDWREDPEHGIGVRINKDGVVIKIGPADIAFL